MVKHIVMWNLAEEADGRTRAENAAIMKQKLEALVGKVPGLLMAQVGLNFTPGGADVCLYAELCDRRALAVYQDHPEHVKVKAFVHQVVTGRSAADFEV